MKKKAPKILFLNLLERLTRYPHETIYALLRTQQKAPCKPSYIVYKIRNLISPMILVLYKLWVLVIGGICGNLEDKVSILGLWLHKRKLAVLGDIYLVAWNQSSCR